MSRSNWVHWSLPVVLIMLVSLVGCKRGGEDIGAVPVSGLVLLDNQPVAGATVSFSPDPESKGALAAVGTTDASGRFTLTTKSPGDGAVPGSYGVVITKTAAAAAKAPADPRGQGRELTPEETKAMLDAMTAATAKKATDVLGGSEIPAKYGARETSGFTATVTQGGNNDFTFAMAK